MTSGVPTRLKPVRPQPALHRSRGGFALPIVLLLVVLLTALLTAGLARTASDLQVATASQAIDEASVVARSGLQTYLGMVSD